MPNRYNTSNLIEDQYEPGSNGKVLRNKRYIVDPEKMEIAETAELWEVQERLIHEIPQDRQFTSDDVCSIHRQWLGSIYPWAGEYRQVNIGKGGFSFAMAHAIPSLMEEFSCKQLQKYTPCQPKSREDVAYALAEVHVELMLIHPFREGNGRLGRLLATLMALQAGLPILDFGEMVDGHREEYFAAIRDGLDRNYQPMQQLLIDAIRRSFHLWN